MPLMSRLTQAFCKCIVLQAYFAVFWMLPIIYSGKCLHAWKFGSCACEASLQVPS